jgi:hypothetical protein
MDAVDSAGSKTSLMRSVILVDNKPAGVHAVNNVATIKPTPMTTNNECKVFDIILLIS